MWPGPYGDGGSRKYLLSSLDQSLRRMGLDYVDVFYHHRPDPSTPLEESMRALHDAVQQGKALYVGVSNYSPARTREAAAILADLGTPLLIHQPSYSMLNRHVEDPAHEDAYDGVQTESLLDVVGDLGVGTIVFSPLQQGLLTDRYLSGSAPEGGAQPPRTRRSCRRRTSTRPTWSAPGRSTRSRGPAARPSRSSPSPGCCATTASPPPSSGRAACSSSRTTSRPSLRPRSPRRSRPPSSPSSRGRALVARGRALVATRALPRRWCGSGGVRVRGRRRGGGALEQEAGARGGSGRGPRRARARRPPRRADPDG